MVLYQSGEYQAFVELYERHCAKVYAYLKRHLYQQDAADDLLQQVFLKLHEHRARYSPSFPFLPWLFSITRNMAIDFVRKKKAMPVEDKELERLAGAATPAEEGEPAMDLQSALKALPRESRELIQMRFEQGLSFAEISDRLQLTAPAVRKRVSRAMLAIRNFLGKKE